MNIENPKKSYKSMYNLLFSCQCHIIFTPKYRRKVLNNPIDYRLKDLILLKQKEYNYEILELEIMPDHVHLLVDINPKISIHSVISKIKGYTSKILRDEFPSLKSRIPSLWTRSSFISSVGSVSLEIVKKYIEEQKSR